MRNQADLSMIEKYMKVNQFANLALWILPGVSIIRTTPKWFYHHVWTLQELHSSKPLWIWTSDTSTLNLAVWTVQKFYLE